MRIKSGTIANVVALILMFAMIISLAALPTANAQEPPRKKTYAIIGAIPNPVGVGQEVLLHIGITDRLVSEEFGWEGLSVTITKPDGTTETLSDIKTDPTGGTGRVYVPTMAGNYTLQTHFPEQLNPADVPPSFGVAIPKGTVMEASDSEKLTLVVQEEPIPYYPGVPLPTEYWTRPINAQFREWSAIAGNWLWGYPNVPYNLIVPNNDGPETAHVLWTHPMVTGGLAGDLDSHDYHMGDAYEGFFVGSIIIDGKLFYNKFNAIGGNNVDNYVVAVDMHTGETLWERALTTPEGQRVDLDNGWLMYWDSFDVHGVFAYLVAETGSVWNMFDPTDGRWLFTLTDIPGGSTIIGPKGELLRYQVNQAAGYMTMWNSTNVIDAYWGTDPVSPNWGAWRPQGKVINATGPCPVTYSTPFGLNGYQWNVSIPDDLPGIVRTVLEDRVIGVEITDTEVNSWGLSLKPGQEGQLLFDKTWQAPSEWATGSLFVDWEAVSGEDNVFVLWARETREHYAFSTETGDYLWGPTPPEQYLNIYKVTLEKYGDSKIVYGKLFSTAMSGILYCYDVTTGDLLWTYTADDPYNEINWGNNWPLIVVFFTDGKVYVGHEVHSPIDPMPRGAPFVCLNATTGELIWGISGAFRQNHWGGRAIIGDSIIATMDTYDMRIYGIGMGPSATTVTASPEVSVLGSSVLVKGTVTDVSPGTKDAGLMMRFPNGVPAVSDANMSDWMKYVYMQFERPADVIGCRSGCERA